MAARFILSLDCEGKWGVADHLGAREHRWLTDERLRSAYRGLLDLLDEYQIAATFAFVGLFGENADEFGRIREVVEPLARRSAYVAAAIDDLTCGSRQGWHGGWAVEAVRASANDHEIALHGVTHVPWTEGDREFLASELALLPLLSSEVRDAKTFVYPRNLVAHPDLLRGSGIEGYRAGRPAKSRLASLASEFNVAAMPDRDPSQADAGLIPIPAGFFVNWQHGLRRLVPSGVSILRYGALLDRAERDQAVVHLWLHPENIASEPATLQLLGQLLRRVAERREQGRCTVLTQLQYVQSQAALRGAMTSASPSTTASPL